MGIRSHAHLAVREGAWGVSSTGWACAALAAAEVWMPAHPNLPQEHLQADLTPWPMCTAPPRVRMERPATLEKERPALAAASRLDSVAAADSARTRRPAWSRERATWERGIVRV